MPPEGPPPNWALDILRTSLITSSQATRDPALVKELLGHASVVSSDVYLHARWGDMRAAVDDLARRAGE
jgi:site-specific recombinase XerC